MKSKLKLGICLGLGIMMLMSGCGKTAEVKPTEQSAPTSEVEKKVEPKVLSLHLAEVESYDPAYAHSKEYSQIGQSIFEGLVKYKNNSYEIEPSLATSWDISSDMKAYTFNLRKDVKFHDGSNFNADSVLYSFERQMKDKRNEDMAYASFIFDVVSKIEKLDDYKVKITLSEPSVVFLTNLAMEFGAPIISSEAHKKDAVAFAQNAVGTGPYKMVKHEKGKSIELEINKEYWGQKPKIDKVVALLEKKETPDKIHELSSGKVDILKLFKQDDIRKLNQENISTAKFDMPYTAYLAYNCTKAPLNNRNFREGISRLINRDEILKSDIDVNGEKAETLIPPSVLGYNSKVKASDYDITKATELLKNFPKDKELSLIYMFATFDTKAKLIVDSLQKVGIKAKSELLKDDEYIERIKTNNFDIAIEGWSTDNGDPDNFMFLLTTESIDSELNTAKFSNKEFDELINKGKITQKNDERRAIYQKAEEILAKEAPILPLYYSGTVYAYSKNLKNFYVHPSQIILFQNMDK